MNSKIVFSTNRLLDALPSTEWAHVLAASEPVALPVRSILYEPGVRPKYAYFLTDGIASIVRKTANGAVVEVGIVGREGLIGAIHLLGSLDLSTQCFMQIAGTGRRMLLMDLERMFSEFIQFRMINACQLAACNASHPIEQRLARWLLNVRDRMQTEQFPLTHEFLAEMLSVQRPTLSIVAKHFQVAGIIAYRHGQLQILLPEKLESLACECYSISQDLIKDLYSPLRQSRSANFLPNATHVPAANGVHSV
jgi:CRP-like cAMP-binding protein